ncbi:Histidine phosphatase superfamily (branch 1) [Marinospirillum celere]|uniref:Histidine phosphatase superfamily (Branch 1) n=1 Tax=Marinospirillum celere TaxID=1122252 RepID=A0A1I1FUR5_9GAMM|nr:histidine phosphatase family protein [Marinospirillum celere]SFC00730.1 Histidine phosphatase superfamily (branch 1) [Marinospirillum celere]
MNNKHSKLLLVFVFLIAGINLPAFAFEPQRAAPELLDQLKTGGYVLYIRHGHTDSSIPDQVPVSLDDCATQRPLTAKGHQQMQQLGQALTRLQLPLDPIISSPFCRTLDSTEAAFPTTGYQVEELLMYTAALTSEEKEPVIARTLGLISKPQPEGSNRALVAHAPNLAELIDYFPPEGSLVIFKPLGDGNFQYLGSIYPDDWPRLLKAKGLADDNQP